MLLQYLEQPYVVQSHHQHKEILSSIVDALGLQSLFCIILYTQVNALVCLLVSELTSLVRVHEPSTKAISFSPSSR